MTIPPTFGKYYYMAKHNTRKECLATAKKLGFMSGSRKGKYVIKKFEEKIQPFFWEKWFNKKAKPIINTVYVLYV